MIRFPFATTLLAASFAGGAAFGQAPPVPTPDLAAKDALRVCGDPSDLPYSNEQGEGFENKIADLIGKDLGVPVSYTWFPDSQGRVRATLMRHRCDVIMDTVAGVDGMDGTQSYYHTSYMLVTRASENISATSVADHALAGHRFGLIAATPPTNILVDHGLMKTTAIYPLVVDTRLSNPSHDMLKDVASGKIDAGLVWGPFAGYYITHEHLPLRAVFLDAAGSKVRLDYHISMGVRSTDTEFRRRLNESIVKNRDKINAILDDYGIPQLDEQGHPVGVAVTLGAPAAK